MITIVGLKPETTYEVKISAINGKGEGESSPPESFKTQPVRKCLSLSVFLSLSVPLYHMTLALSLPINPPSSAQQQTTLPTMHPCLGPYWISLPRDALLVLFVCFCIYMWMCVFIQVCVRVFKQCSEGHSVTAASHLSSASQWCGAPSRPYGSSAGASMCQATAVSRVYWELCVLC